MSLESTREVFRVPDGIYLLKVNNRNTSLTRCEICSKLTIKSCRSGFFNVNFEHISHLVLVFLLLTLAKQKPVWTVSNIYNEVLFKKLSTDKNS